MHQQIRIQRSTPIQLLSSIERFRQIIALTIIVFYISWLLFGLVVLASKGSGWLLVSSLFLTYPVYLILNYYFRIAKKKSYQ